MIDISCGFKQVRLPDDLLRKLKIIAIFYQGIKITI
jgi:hypothetical protein